MKKIIFFPGMILLALVISLSAFSQKIDLSHLDNGRSPDSLLRLYTEGNGYSDETIILFIHDATAGFDPQYDAYKLTGAPDAPQFYSIIACCNLAVNVLPTIEDNLMVQMGYDVGAETNYFIEVTEATFPGDVDILLEDTRDGTWTNLSLGTIYNFTAHPDDASERFRVWFNKKPALGLTAFFEGAFSSGQMSTDLKDNGLLPLNQPFNMAPWNYAGSESVVSIPDDVVDWVLVDIRDAANGASAGSAASVEMMAGFILMDGSIVGLDGISNLQLSQAVVDGLFPVVIHRNHLDIMAASAISDAGGYSYVYDFTSGSAQAYGSNAQKNVDGNYVMFAGDANADGTVNTADESTIWESNAGENGYFNGDFNLDGEVDNKGKNDLLHENLNQNCQVPN